MERKMKYIAPAVLDELKIEMEGSILMASHVDEPIEEDIHIEAMGQDLGEDIECKHDWN